MITSTSNAQIKNLIQLQTKTRTRKEQGVFVVEGRKMCEEARSNGLVKYYVSETFYRDIIGEVPDYFDGAEYECVLDSVVRQAAETVSPQGILAVVRQQQYSLEDMLKGNRIKLLLLEDIRDPGNMGTMLRTAEGAGITGVVMSRETVDIYNPKVIRSTMGSIFRVPFCYTDNFETAIRQIREQGVTLYAAHLRGKALYDEIKYPPKSGVLIGNEAGGLREQTAELTDCYLKIPMSGEVESLNAAVAAALIMYQMR